MTAPRQLGVLGEDLAARYLADAGYEIVARNYRVGHREVDLVISRDGVVAFVEVKARAGEGYGHPLEAITALKRREIERVARSWLRRHRRPRVGYRFDAVGVFIRPGGSHEIEHVPDAWRMGE